MINEHPKGFDSSLALILLWYKSLWTFLYLEDETSS